MRQKAAVKQSLTPYPNTIISINTHTQPINQTFEHKPYSLSPILSTLPPKTNRPSIQNSSDVYTFSEDVVVVDGLCGGLQGSGGFCLQL